MGRPVGMLTFDDTIDGHQELPRWERYRAAWHYIERLDGLPEALSDRWDRTMQEHLG